MEDKYNIYCRGRKIYKEVSEEVMLDVLSDMASEYHENGEPDPDDIHVELIDSNGVVRNLTRK